MAVQKNRKNKMLKKIKKQIYILKKLIKYFRTYMKMKLNFKKRLVWDGENFPKEKKQS